MTPRERFHAVMGFEAFDRLPLIEWATYWDLTVERWLAEGLCCASRGRERPSQSDLLRHFGFDDWRQDWLGVRGAGCPAPRSHGAGLIETHDDYTRLREHLFPSAVDAARWQAWAEAQRREGAVLWFTLEGFFWFPRTLLGIEQHLYAFYEEPELLHRINTDLVDWMVRCLDGLTAICVPDFMTFAEDMSYNHGPMISKKLFDEFMLPYYRRIVPRLVERGILTFVDSDGDITEAASWFDAAGIQGMLPLERQSGVDVAKLRQLYPRMRFIGAYDKRVIHHGEAAMRAEFERLMSVATGGGFMPSADHQTPPDVSLETYELYGRLFMEYAVRAAG
jgi:hypothetical protein